MASARRQALDEMTELAGKMIDHTEAESLGKSHAGKEHVTLVTGTALSIGIDTIAAKYGLSDSEKYEYMQEALTKAGRRAMRRGIGLRERFVLWLLNR
jgi:hypothetical protein